MVLLTLLGSVFMAAAAALVQPEKHPKFDFFLM
jgi:hypothetical protein